MELQTWLKTGKCSLENVPTVVSARAYGDEWIKWWTAAQPQERETQQWPFSRDSISDIGWGKFPANGKDGIYLAIMGLSWWASAIWTSNEVAFFEEAVIDLHWVIWELIRTRTNLISPPSLPPSQDKPTRRKQKATPRPSASSSCPPTSSRPPVSASGAHIHSRGEGKRVVRPSRKARGDA